MIKKLLYTLLIFTGGIQFVQSQTVQSFVNAGTFTWQAPCDVTSIIVECWGAGGSGGGATVNASASSGGSGGGYVKNTSFTVVPGTIYTITVGAGGIGSNTSGVSGGASWFSSVTSVKAVGGLGGSIGSPGLAVNSGNVGFTPGFSFYGGSGAANTGTGTSGGGGSSAGTGSNGLNAIGAAAGIAVPGGVIGGVGRTTSNNGGAGGILGGGGGGARVTTAAKNGGVGGKGKVQITYITSVLVYCVPTFTTNINPITNVTFAGINNSTSGTVGGTPASEKFCLTGNVLKGSLYTISVSGNTNGNFSDFIKVFFDWNQDGDFIDANEVYSIGSIVNCTNCNISSSITVPCIANVGNTRMRVIKRRSGYSTSACQTGAGSGQAEEYNITVTAPPNTTPTSQPTSLIFSSITGTQISGSFTAASPAPTNYLVVRTLSSSTPSPLPVNGLTYSVGSTLGGGVVVSVNESTSFISSGLTSNTQYWFWVYSFNNSCTPYYLTTSPISLNATTASIVNWIGKGVGAATGTDFNLGSNWDTGSVPGPFDNAIIITTAAASSTITLSADINVGSLTILNNVTVANIVLALDASTFKLTVNGDLSATVKSTNANSTTNVSLRVGNGSGNITVGGTATFGNSNVVSKITITGSAGGSTTGTFTFNGDVYFNGAYKAIGGYIGAFIWDKNGNQNIYTNSTNDVSLSGSCQIGLINSPTVSISSNFSRSLLVHNIANANLTVKSGSTLDLGSRNWNKSTTAPSLAGGSVVLEAGSVLILGSTSGGQSGSNYPLNFTSAASINSSSTVEYNSTSTQDIYPIASPGYGNLTCTGNSNKRLLSSIYIRGNFRINTTSTASSSSGIIHYVGGDWINDGTFSASTSTIELNGSTSQLLDGISLSSFNNLSNNNSSTGLILNTNIQVVGVLAMQGTNAKIDLNGFNIDLSSTGILTGETNSNRIFGTSGVITTTKNLNNISSLNVGGLGAVLSTTSNMGSTTVSRGHTLQVGVGLDNITLARYYRITPTNDTGLDASMVFNYFNDELSSGLAANETSLILFSSDDGGASWTGQSGSNDPANDNISLIHINAFSDWTISVRSGVVLPISLISFEGVKLNRENLISWKTASEMNNAYFTVERSVDGKYFETLIHANGAGISTEIKSYSFTDKNFQMGINYYRLRQTDFNGEYSFSEIVLIDNSLVIKKISKIINLHGQEVDEHYKGVVIIVYTDNSILRTVQ